MSIPQIRTGAPLFLGVEGGATRTIAIVADEQEHLFKRVETGPANLRLLSDAQLAELLKGLARKLPRPAALCLGLAGLRTESDRARAVAAARMVWPNVPCWPCSDLETALSAAQTAPADASGPVQVLVLSGTGSCCYGRDPLGKTTKIGGWGHLLGDKGSGYEIGLRALKAVVYYYDRDGVWSALGQRILRTLLLNEPENLIGWAQHAEKAEIAALAVEVFDAWAARDKIASDILEGAAESLANDAAACARKIARSGMPVQFVLAGSVLLKQPRFAARVAKQVKARWPRASIALLEREGAWGAVRLAIAQWQKEQATPPRPPPHDQPTHLRPIKSKTAAGIEVTEFVVPESTELSPTERRNPRSRHLDRMPAAKAIRLILSEEAKVPRILEREHSSIQACLRLIVSAFRKGGRLYYVGAGTSGRLGTLDASECPPTFRTPPDQVQAIMAGGARALYQSIEGAEDEPQAGAAAVRFRGVQRTDVVVGIAASGRTPFVWGALQQAKALGAKTILLCFNPHLRISREAQPDLVLAPDLGPEILTGSTRLKAGTATKLLLNLFTTLSMVALGKVVSNLMVDVHPSNQKLRARAVRIVRELTGATETAATRALTDADWVIKDALKRVGRSRT